MLDMLHDQIVAVLEEIRAGNGDPERVSDLEMCLIDLLLNEGEDAVGAFLLSLEGMKFTLIQEPSVQQITIFRSDHESNALLVEVFAAEDLASVSINPEQGEVPELPAGHQWFYGIWEKLIREEFKDSLIFSEPNRTVYLIASFEADVMNGGVGQYLSNTNGKFVDDTIEALNKVGATKTASHLHKASRLKIEDESWDEMWERTTKQLRQLDDQIMKDDEYLSMLTAVYFGEDSKR